MSKYTCPHCGSENTASIPLTYKRGHSVGEASNYEEIGREYHTKVTKYSDGSKKTEDMGTTPIYGWTKHDTWSLSDLAREVAPPQKPKLHSIKTNVLEIGCVSIGCLLPIALMILYVILYNYVVVFNKPLATNITHGIGYFAVFAIIVSLIMRKIKDYKQNKLLKEKYQEALKQYEKDLAEWRKMYICLRCGHKFKVEPD